MDSLRVSMNSWGMDGKAQAEYEDLLVSSPLSPPGLSSSPPHAWPTSPLFPELDEYGRLGCSFEDDHTPFDEDEDEEGNVDDVDEETVTLGSGPPAPSDLTILVDNDEESEEDVPLAKTRLAKWEASKVKSKSSNVNKKHKPTPKSSRRLSKRTEVKPLPTRASPISLSSPDTARRAIRSRTPSPAPSLRSPSPALSDGSSYSTSLAARARPRRGASATRRRSPTEIGSTKGKRVRVYKPRTGPARQDQNKAAQKKYRDKVKDAAKATFRYAQTVRRAVGSTGNGRCRECPVCQKVRSATAALEEELDHIDPRHAELLRSEAVL